MFSDFLILLAATIFVIDWTMKRLIPMDWAGPILGGVLLSIVALRIVGSTAFRKKTAIPKVALSLGLLALGLGSGNPTISTLIAALIVAIAVMMFGIYYMCSSLFRTR
ncbi:MAG: hypothetical protein JO036_11905 [Candidatus Eremiobacteraeota bacterium]|nr:hypothetical protein [Candidatus Eremiobacteraeota bacterium]